MTHLPARIVLNEIVAPAVFATVAENGKSAVERDLSFRRAAQAVGSAACRTDNQRYFFVRNRRDNRAAPVFSAFDDKTRADGKLAQRRCFDDIYLNFGSFHFFGVAATDCTDSFTRDCKVLELKFAFEPRALAKFS